MNDLFLTCHLWCLFLSLFAGRFDQGSKGLLRLGSRLFCLFGIDPPGCDDLGEVVLSVIWYHGLPTWLLNVIDVHLEIIQVGNTEPSCDVELFQAFADVRELLVGHLSVQLAAERGPDKEESGHHLRLFVERSQVTLLTVLVLLLSQSVFESAIINLLNS